MTLYLFSGMFVEARISEKNVLARIIHTFLSYDRHLHAISDRTRASRLNRPPGYASVAHCSVRSDLTHL